MVVGITLLIVAVLIVAIWVIIEVKRLRHKIFAIFLIMVVLFTYISFTLTLGDKDLDFGKISGWGEAAKIYFAWLGSVFGNLKSITAQVISLDWVGNSSAG